MSGERIRINGVELRYGQTYVGRIGPRRKFGNAASTRFTSLSGACVHTDSAILAVVNAHFIHEARRSKRYTRDFYTALERIEQNRKQPSFRNANAAVAIAGLVLIRRDALDAAPNTFGPDAPQNEEWTTDVGELSMTTDGWQPVNWSVEHYQAWTTDVGMFEPDDIKDGRQ